MFHRVDAATGNDRRIPAGMQEYLAGVTLMNVGCEKVNPNGVSSFIPIKKLEILKSNFIVIMSSLLHHINA